MQPLKTGRGTEKLHGARNEVCKRGLTGERYAHARFYKRASKQSDNSVHGRGSRRVGVSRREGGEELVLVAWALVAGERAGEELVVGR